MVARGPLLPFAVTAAGDVANGTDADLAVSKVLLVLGTRPGEIDWRPTFGCGIHMLRHQSQTEMLVAMAGYHIRVAFATWLPSLVLTQAPAVIPDGRAMRVKVRFNQRTGAGGVVFPADLTAEIQVPMASTASS